MKKLYLIPALLLLFSGFIASQDNSEEVVEVSTVEALLALVKEGKTQEQAANSDREAEFMANKNKQASILAAEKRELARQEKIADTLEALLLVNKKLSIDSSFKGDFNLNNEKISKDSENQFIFTGLQIINRSVFANEKSEVFSLNKVWNKLIKDKNLLGVESNQKFYHLNTSDMYKKIQSLNIID